MIWNLINWGAWGLSGILLVVMLYDFYKVEQAAKKNKE